MRPLRRRLLISASISGTVGITTTELVIGMVTTNTFGSLATEMDVIGRTATTAGANIAVIIKIVTTGTIASSEA